MLTVLGTYQKGRLILYEPVDTSREYKVLVTFVDDFAVTQKPKRVIGGLKGKIWLSDDFNEPLDDLKEYM